MILGIGTDLCDIRRIEKVLARFGERFTNRIFDYQECEKAKSKLKPAHSYAQGFAAKEACAKALGTGFCQGVFWRDMVIRNLDTGQPFVTIKRGALMRLEAITPQHMEAQINISQSDEYPYAHAIVIISADRSK